MIIITVAGMAITAMAGDIMISNPEQLITTTIIATRMIIMVMAGEMTSNPA